MKGGLAAQGPVMKAHFIDVGQANATLLEFQCGVVLIDAGSAAGWPRLDVGRMAGDDASTRP